MSRTRALVTSADSPEPRHRGAAATTASGLVIDAVSWSVGRDAVVRAVSLTARRGELVAVSGPSGSGKTTLLSLAGGLLRPDDGSIAFDDQSVWQGSGDPRPYVAFILQTYGLVPILTARENVAIAMRARGRAPDESNDLADRALERLGVRELGQRQVEELSGGQMQRVAGARGLVIEPALLLADEPTSELDEFTRDTVIEELRREAQRGAAVLVATHDPAVVVACDREYHLVDGRVERHSLIATA